jgi:hypothetical protein
MGFALDKKNVKDVKVCSDMEIRYMRLENPDSWDDKPWHAVAWRVMEGRWHRCNAFSKSSRKLLGANRFRSDFTMRREKS